MSRDETPDTTGLREGDRLNLRSLKQAKALAAHPTPDASLDPAVVTPDAGDDALRDLLNRHRPTWDKRCRECGMKVPESGCPTWILANHVAAAREADRAGDVEALAKVLAEHGAFTGYDSCRCGWRAERSGWNPPAHQRHVAEAVANHVAAAREADRAGDVEAWQRENRIALWKQEALDPERDEALSPLVHIIDSLEKDCRAAGANHVAAAREADRAGDVEALLALLRERWSRVPDEDGAISRAMVALDAAREPDRAEADALRAALSETDNHWRHDLARAEAAEERLAGLVAKIEALADLPTPGPAILCASPKDRDDQWRAVIRALIPADAATALDAVKAEARAAERERIAQAIEAQESCASPANTCYRDHEGCFVAESLRIARHTPEATA